MKEDPAGAKAPSRSSGETARLKSCPFKAQGLKPKVFSAAMARVNSRPVTKALGKTTVQFLPAVPWLGKGAAPSCKMQVHSTRTLFNCCAQRRGATNWKARSG